MPKQSTSKLPSVEQECKGNGWVCSSSAKEKKNKLEVKRTFNLKETYYIIGYKMNNTLKGNEFNQILILIQNPSEWILKGGFPPSHFFPSYSMYNTACCCCCC